MTANIKIVRSHRKSISMSVEPDYTVLVKAPILMPKIFINRFIKEHVDWINKQLARQPKIIKKNYQHGEEFLFLGLPVKLLIGNYKEISVEKGKLFFPDFLKFRIEKQLTTWYIKQARKLISDQVELFAKEMKASYSGLTFSDTTSKWGSCSRDNHLQFSWRLIMTPILTINYVVVHELAHTLEKNHSRDFWRIVEKYIPSYKIQRRWLKKNGKTLIV